VPVDFLDLGRSACHVLLQPRCRARSRFQGEGDAHDDVPRANDDDEACSQVAPPRGGGGRCRAGGRHASLRIGEEEARQERPHRHDQREDDQVPPQRGDPGGRHHRRPFVIGQTRPHGILRTLGVGCGDFPPATVPGSSNFCTFNYQEAKLGRHPTIKAWELPLATGRVDFSAYDGSVVSGTFSSVLTSVSGEPPVTVEGQFSGHIAASH
jgi:hypothetical protein